MSDVDRGRRVSHPNRHPARSEQSGPEVPLSTVASPAFDERLAYSPGQAGVLLGLSRSRVYELLADGSLASFKIGRNRRIRRDALVAFLDRLEASAHAGGGP
ncbi:MAG: helix-turn-helix domain-containing protein [Acidimicrobiales bacterium]